MTSVTFTPGASMSSLWSSAVEADCPGVGPVSVWVAGQYDSTYPQSTESGALGDVDLGVCVETGGCKGYQYGASAMYGNPATHFSVEEGPTLAAPHANVVFSATVSHANGGTSTHTLAGSLARR